MNALDLEIRSLGADLVCPPQGESVRPTPSGDWPGVEGRPCLKADILDRAMTMPGELVHRPQYGAGLERFVEAPATPTTRGQIIAALRGNLERDPRLAEIAVKVAAPVDGRTVITLQTQIRTGANDAPPLEAAFPLE